MPITDSSGRIYISALSVYHALNFFGRSANATASVPYAVGNFRAKVADAERNAYRSGLVDMIFRFSVNLKGGPALSPPRFRAWKQKTLIGASLKVVAPTGQYDPAKLINFLQARNPGADQHRQVELLEKLNQGRMRQESEATPELEASIRSMEVVGAFEGHLSYDVRPRLWASLDSNFWHGGTASINGIENRLSLQSNSRIGGTASVPVSVHQSLKFSYSRGAYVRYGGNFQNVSIGWQYSWLGKPE